MSEPLPLSQRRKDLGWFAFFLIHLIASLCIDLQGVLPSSFYPSPLKSFYAYYLTDQADPLLTNQDAPAYIWFKTFIYCEVFFQLPVFVLGMYLLRSRPSSPILNPLLLVYSTHAFTTILPCFSTILTADGDGAPTYDQKVKLVCSYASITIPILFMLFDSWSRVVRDGVAARMAEKKKD
ncbi:hypothetical protein BT69DRAFT_1237310 [Atractiella rhizophila]|nr:hypothetical protein BT69DRAFT_1237310 [Atractiella rhizophila]